MRYFRTLQIIFLLFSVALGSGVSFGTDIDLTGIRNPFDFGSKVKIPKKNVNGKEKSVRQKGYRLGLIMIKGDSKTAMINKKRYKEGDKVGKYVIESITLNYIGISDGFSSRRVQVDEVFR